MLYTFAKTFIEKMNIVFMMINTLDMKKMMLYNSILLFYLYIQFYMQHQQGNIIKNYSPQGFMMPLQHVQQILPEITFIQSSKEPLLKISSKHIKNPDVKSIRLQGVRQSATNNVHIHGGHLIQLSDFHLNDFFFFFSNVAIGVELNQNQEFLIIDLFE